MGGTRRLAAAAGATAVALLLLTGCVQGPMPVPSATPSARPTSVRPEADPVLRPGESAAANQQFFDFVNGEFFAAHGQSDGRSIVDNLVASGFLKPDMEVTADKTAIGEPVASIIVAVRVDDECLIGQYLGTGYAGTRAPLLGTGTCLVGKTRPIDW